METQPGVNNKALATLTEPAGGTQLTDEVTIENTTRWLMLITYLVNFVASKAIKTLSVGVNLCPGITWWNKKNTTLLHKIFMIKGALHDGRSDGTWVCPGTMWCFILFESYPSDFFFLSESSRDTMTSGSSSMCSNFFLLLSGK